jgi:predicted DNA-binding protein YlxM (UPF0122 family)
VADDKTKIGKPDRDRINPNEDYELQDWATHFGVSKEKVKQTVEKVGPMVDDVEKALKSNR